MALSSLSKILSDKISYFSNWKFNFQKTRVIDSLRYIDEALLKLVESPFYVKINRGEIFYNRFPDGDISSHKWTLFYEEALFLNHVIENWEFDINKLSKYEQIDYKLAASKLKKWNQVKNIMQDIEAFVGEIMRVVTIRNTSRSPLGYNHYKFPQYEWSIVARYHIIAQQLEPYPEWLTKFKNEVEPYVKLLSDLSPVPLGFYPIEVYRGIDLHKYFK
ncbi:hypothetical protein SteCoe_6734 [Stentor coeruleus]|uniref:Uncharacterized protein n=1 Tax=Stentor coeruleus TaxID=5963 RepID=A0A1R2CPG7_9CILI|nr:hypothetical protein SteCoe_6734 [Stentor coeruleus]